MEGDPLLESVPDAVCTTAAAVPPLCASGVLVPAHPEARETPHRASLKFAMNPSVAVHAVILLAAVLWLATGLDFFLVLIASLLIVMLCCLPQVLWCRIVDWVALALVVVVLVYRDHSAIFEDVMLVVFRVHHNATVARL
jgi:hypothetical protein